MSQLIKKSGVILSTLVSLVVLTLMANVAQADGDGHGRKQNIGHNNASDGVMGQIRTNKSIVYIGDPLEIGIRFPRGAQLIIDGEVDAWLLIFSPDAETIPVSVSNVASAHHRKLFTVDSVDIGELPEGVYQLGLVITVPGGDPLDLNDWYNGLKGLITVRGLTVSGMPLELDVDGDGELECDLNEDGLIDGDDEIACEEGEGPEEGMGEEEEEGEEGEPLACDLNEDGVIDGDDEVACAEDESEGEGEGEGEEGGEEPVVE